MCAKFSCGPTVVSKKKGGVQTDRQTKKTAALYSRWVNIMVPVLKSGPKSRQKLVIRSDYCAGESGIPSENLGCSG